MVTRTDRAGIRIEEKNGGFTEFSRDLLNLSNNFEKLTKSQLLKIMRTSARAYVTKYNKTMGREGAKRMATAKLGANYATGKETIRVKVTTTLLSKYYDVAKPHYVSINNKPTLRKWVQTRWKFSKEGGWRAGKRRAKLSLIYGPQKRPFGSLYVTSYASRHGGVSVHDLSMQRAKDVFNIELKSFMNRWSRDSISKFMKKEYENKIFMTM